MRRSYGIALIAVIVPFHCAWTVHAAAPVSASYGAQITLPFRGLSTRAYYLAVDGADNVFVSDEGNNRVVELTSGGVQSTLPFSGLNGPEGIGVDGSGTVFVLTSFTSQLLELSKGGVETGFPGALVPSGLAVDASDQPVMASILKRQVYRGLAADLLPFTGLGKPFAVAVDDSGDVFVTDRHRLPRRLPRAPGRCRGGTTAPDRVVAVVVTSEGPAPSARSVSRWGNSTTR